MSFRNYREYKDSGIRWLGRVPSQWTVKAAKHSFAVVGGSTPKSENAAYWDGAVVWVTPADLSDLPRLEVKESGRRITSEGLASCGTTLVPAGSIVLSTRAPIGSLAIAGTALCTNQGCKSLVPKGPADSRFFAYLLSSAKEELNVWGRGTTFLELSADALGALLIVEPALDEQAAIAAFLDRETAKIDALVEEQKRLIELLKEKRQAVISQAVTKGLDPNVPMKDSGVEWLGKVPAHWDVSSIKHIVATPVTDGPHETPIFPDEGIPFVSAEAVSSGVLDFEKKRGYISAEDHQRYSLKYRPKRGDIFMIKSGATTGVTAIVETDEDFNIWSPLAVIRCNASCDPYFILNYLRSRNFLEAVTLNWSFGTQQNIGMGVIENLCVPVPPMLEQRRIAQALSGTLRGLDSLSTEADRAISLLVERRSALISAAVTGKIDVRGLAPQ
jgi:type I restriction enzyme S subunit